MIVYCICDCFELLLTSLGRSRKITIQNVALNSTNTAEMQINWKACLHCIIVGARQRKEHLKGVQSSACQRFIICSKMWMNLRQWFGPYVHQGSKGREMGHKLQRSCRESFEKGQSLHCCAKSKDLSSDLWTKRTAASTSGFSPFSPRWCWWSLWADNWNESRADFNIVAWKF